MGVLNSNFRVFLRILGLYFRVFFGEFFGQNFGIFLGWNFIYFGSEIQNFLGIFWVRILRFFWGVFRARILGFLGVFFWLELENF